MKTKHFFKGFAITGTLLMLLRLLQYFFITGPDGYFTKNGILAWSVYVVLGIGAITCIIMSFASQKEQADFNRTADTKSIGLLFIVCAVIIMIITGILVSQSSFRIYFPIDQTQIPKLLNMLSAIFGILCAVYFALVGIKLRSDKPVNVPDILGIFAPLYFAFSGINEFYASFERAGKSETKLFMVTVCALALFTMSLSLCFCKAEVSRGRVIASAGMVVLSASLTSIPTLIAMAFSLAEFTVTFLLNALLHSAFLVIAYTVLIRLSFADNSKDSDEIEPVEFAPLNKFLNEIPDEDRGNNE